MFYIYFDLDHLLQLVFMHTISNVTWIRLNFVYSRLYRKTNHVISLLSANGTVNFLVPDFIHLSQKWIRRNFMRELLIYQRKFYWLKQYYYYRLRTESR